MGTYRLYEPEQNSLSLRKIQEQYPVLGPNEEVAEVEQKNFGVTDSKDKKPIIATYGLYTCIGLVGYDRIHNLGFLMHIDPLNSVQGGLEGLYQELARTHPDYDKEFEAHMVASTFHHFQTFRNLEEVLRGSPSGLGTKLKFAFPIEFVPDTKRERGKPGEGVALDTRTGTIFAYLRDKIRIREGPYDFKYNKPIPKKVSFGFGRF